MNLKELEIELRKNPEYVKYEKSLRGRIDVLFIHIENTVEMFIVRVKIWLSKLK